MVESAVADMVQRYLRALPDYGIHAKRAVLFGSCARGQTDEWSDIDLIVIAPEFDASRAIGLVKKLWLATEAADDRM